MRKRHLLVATLTPTDGSQPFPPLLDAQLLTMTAQGVMSLLGEEDVSDGSLCEERTFSQSWLLTPAVHEDLDRAERNLGRLAYRLKQEGLIVRMLPGGDMQIPGELHPDDRV